MCETGNYVHLVEKDDKAWNQWRFNPDGTIENEHCPGLVLDIDGGDNSCDDGLSIVISKKSSGRQNQQWFLRDGFLENRKCQHKGVDIANYSTDNGSRIQLSSFSGRWNQRWFTTIPKRYTSIEFDPLTVQFYAGSDLMASVGFGLVRATLDGDVELKGNAQLVYCSYCSDAAITSSFQPVGSSSFYFQRKFGYELSGGVSLVSDIPGMDSQIGAQRLSIADDNVFDDIPPNMTLPSSQDLLDSIKFTPQRAVGTSLPALPNLSLFF
jgi:hypothetical protein